MTHVLKSLETLSTGYSVFEKDQVLTHDQLNSVTDWLDDQDRTTRTWLHGVGTVCGLSVSLQSNNVLLTKGVGVTTDGDLFAAENGKNYNRFRAFIDPEAIYEPLQNNGEWLELYELIESGAEASDVTPLSQFKTVTSNNLNEMVVVLYIETYQYDPDICTSTDCDNLGKDYKSTPRLLLVKQTDAKSLKANLATLNDIFVQLPEVFCQRPVLSSADNTPSKLLNVYKSSATATAKQLEQAFKALSSAGASLLKDTFSNDPVVNWQERMKKIMSDAFSTSIKVTGFQYAQDFLNDVVGSYSKFKAVLANDKSICCPDKNAFPKHLLLGGLNSILNTEFRTGFYPSPSLSHHLGHHHAAKHAQFYLQQLHHLISNYDVPKDAIVKITPSNFNSNKLKAIPYFYEINEKLAIQQYWNLSFSQQNKTSANYGYFAEKYGATGAAATPLLADFGDYSGFRIEGHIGRQVDSAINAIEKLITDNNLPMSVTAVALTLDRKNIFKRPGLKYTDLHRFHHVLRQDLLYQADAIKTFSSGFKNRVFTAVDSGTIKETESEGPRLKELATEKHDAIVAKTGTLETKINQKYSLYKADSSWKSDLSDAMSTAGEYKADLGKIAKTEYATPFDSMISSTHLQWLDWLDILIQDREDKDDDKKLFSEFLKRHPGAIHTGGTTKGGTFVLIHHDDGTVLGDLMLPYTCCEEQVEEPEQPKLPKPPIYKPGIIDNGIKIIPSINQTILGKLDGFKIDLDKQWNDKFTFQTQYLDVVKDSFNMIGTVFKETGTKTGTVTTGLRDEYLEILVNQAEYNKQRIDYLNVLASRNDVDEATRTYYENQSAAAEKELAETIKNTAEYVDKSGKEVTRGSEAETALVTVNKSRGAIRNSATKEALNTNLNAIAENSENAGFKGALTEIIGLMR